MNRNFKLGEIELSNPFILAPLAGFTDKTMRTLCEEQGASLTFTEMISGKGLKYGDRKTNKLLELTASEAKARKHQLYSLSKDITSENSQRLCGAGFQIFGSEPEILNYSAQELADRNNLTIDLNCGCPVPKIVKNGEGSALLRDLDLLYDCVRAMVDGNKAGFSRLCKSIGDSVQKPRRKPVTVKMRMGFEQGENIAVEAAKAVEAAGADGVTIHGRTRQQYYEGKADWNVIAQVKDAVRIPVVGNGDIKNGRDAIQMMYETGCDAVMIARGALGNPWIFREAIALWNSGWQPGVDNPEESERTSREVLAELGMVEPTIQERLDMLVRHLDMICEDKGERIGVREIRKFVGYYTRGIHGATAVRREVNRVEDRDGIVRVVRSLGDIGL